MNDEFRCDEWTSTTFLSMMQPIFSKVSYVAFNQSMTGWWLTYPSEKWWSSSVGMILPIYYGKIKNVPNHQPDEIKSSLNKNRYNFLPSGNSK